MRHIARSIPFEELLNGLESEVSNGNINFQSCPEGRLRIYCYSKACVSEKVWNTHTIAARGIILDTQKNEVLATPFPKFFNYGEGGNFCDGATRFQIYEKLDGSLIILFYHDGKWKTATKGSFESSQAVWASNYVKKHADTDALTPGHTYLFEATYPENRIVVPHTDEKLTLLAAYDNYGFEYTYEHLKDISVLTRLPLVKQRSFNSIPELVAHTKSLPFTEEGYVVKLEDGTRLKFKGDEYCRLHRAISNLTPLALWEMLLEGDDENKYRSEIPEEFWKDFDTIIGMLKNKIARIAGDVIRAVTKYEHLSNKEVIQYYEGDKVLRSLMLQYRKNPYLMEIRRDINGLIIANSPRKVIFNLVRPKANVLDGYTPSSVVNHFNEENE